MKTRFAPKLKIKKGDIVKMITGDDKGKQGRVLSVIVSENRAIVEGINIVKKHTKPNAKDTKGGIIKKEAPVRISNMMLVDPKSGKLTRVGRKVVDGKIVRYAKNSGEVIK